MFAKVAAEIPCELHLYSLSPSHSLPATAADRTLAGYDAPVKVQAKSPDHALSPASFSSEIGLARSERTLLAPVALMWKSSL